MFRSGTYPGYLLSDFDYAYTRLTGFKATDNFSIGKVALKSDLLFTTQTDIEPFFDWSLSWLVSAKFCNFLSAGAGVSFSHLVSVNENYTTPKVPLNQFLNDSLTATRIDSDTGYYTFRGVKLGAHICLDPKGLLPPLTMFGKEDLKLYSEVLIDGLKNYPGYYNNLKERTVVTFGFNVPAFKLLDVFAVEGEWYGNPYQDSYYGIVLQHFPLPTAQTTGKINGFDYDNWKWSVYAKKTIVGGLSIIGQAARDHYRGYSEWLLSRDYEPLTVKNGQWYWMLKFEYGF
jgi:hypothetical protein